MKRFMRFAWPLCLPLCIVCLAADQDEQYSGSFKNQQISVMLTPQGAGYLGRIDEGFNTYRLSCRPENGKLVGSFINVDGNSYAFTATLSGDQLNFNTGSTSYELVRDRTALNPLAIESHNPFSPTTSATKSTASTQPVATLSPAMKESAMGIGAQFNNVEGKFQISNLMVKSPAAEAGLQIGDQLLEIDGTPPGPLENPGDRIRAITTGEVRIAVLRNGKRLEFSVKRQPMNFSSWA